MKKTKKLFGNPNQDHRRWSKVPLLVIALIAIIGFMPAVLSLTGCADGGGGGGGGGGIDERLVGKWYDSDGDEALDFKSNGKLTLWGDPDWTFSYSVSGNTITIKDSDGDVAETATFVYSVSGSTATLTISGTDHSLYLNGTYTRTVSGGNNGGSGDERLLGKWYDSHDDEALDFQSNGKLILRGDPDFTYNYKVSGNTLIFFDDDGREQPPLTYAISGSGSTATLTISGPNNWGIDGTYTHTVGGGGNPLAQWLNGLQTTAQSNGNYEYTVTENEALAPQTLSYTGKSDITVTLKADSPVTITRSGSGRLFRVDEGVTLVLGNNITLSGGGVEVLRDGTFTMNGGKISGSSISSSDSSAYGGGVYVNNDGTFTMNGGEISGNTVNTTASWGSSYGGGVYVSPSGTFTMNDGKISGNTATCASYASGTSGGGVYAGSFTMNGGEISGNTARSDRSNSGGGVRAGTFTMNGGKISGNSATGTAANDGGGVNLSGNFTMNGGEISGNTASGTDSRGGGVYMGGTNTNCRIVNGTIYGTNEADTALRNTARSDRGPVLYTSGNNAQCGTFSGDTWNGTDITGGSWGSSIFDKTIKVVNGVLQ